MAGSAAAAAHGEAAAQPAAEPRVAVITTLGCTFCKRAKDALKSAGVPFEEVELSRDLDLLRSIQKSTGLRTVPQVSGGCHAAALLRRTLMSPNASAAPSRSLSEASCWAAQPSWWAPSSGGSVRRCSARAQAGARSPPT